MPKAAPTKTVSKHKFIIDYSKPAADGIFDGGEFEKIPPRPHKGLWANFLFFISDAGSKLVITTSIQFSKRYLKYLTKKFLKKQSIRDWVRVVAPSKDVYQLRYNAVQNDEEDEE
ncbi:60S ribosomal protein [Mycena indigotica]|uniref:60S ribosomal protein n=1 Tax=Mycena indigotica TaxID=2126181 RepID=A0A8H6SGI4_9AGAR|nr:60S ribosomal protein [Mycena indigotica]KAF7299143.1 60S ribosomal protein [Mycena indigotica]